MIIRSSENVFSLVDGNGFPRFWPTAWVALIGGSLSCNTLKSKLRDIGAFYRFSDSHLGAGVLEDVIARTDFKTLEGTLEAFFVTLKNAPNRSTMTSWKTLIGFLREISERICRTVETSETIHSINCHLSRIERLYLQLPAEKRTPTAIVRSLPSGVMKELNDNVIPTHKNNPFKREDVQWRAYAIYHLLLDEGLRRGEALGLPADFLKFEMDSKGKTTFWINVINNQYEADPRHTTPSIKTPTSIRQIPVGKSSAEVFMNYSANYRGSPPHSFFLNSTLNRPLSAEAVNQMFIRLTRSLSTEAIRILKERTGKQSVTPHDLRHTAAVIRYKQFRARGEAEDSAMQLIRSLFGWSPDSTMPLLYAKAALEEALNGKFADDFDDRVEMLRQLPE